VSIQTTYTIIPELRLILTYSQGKMQVTDLMQLSMKIIQDEAYDSTFDIIWDLRATTALGFKMDILEYIDFLKNNLRLKNRIRSSVLLNTPNQKFLMSIFKPFAKLNNIDAENFLEIEKCFKWMGYSESEQVVVNEAFANLKNSLSSLE
jgi:hypothetical protein